MPGKIVQNLTKSGTKNPFFLLDEIDKIGQDFRGDPASVMLARPIIPVFFKPISSGNLLCLRWFCKLVGTEK